MLEKRKTMWWQVPALMLGVLSFGFMAKALSEWVIDIRDVVRADHMRAYLDGERERP